MHEKSYSYRFLGLILSFTCLCFVFYQTQNCIRKYQQDPKSTDVTIVKASEHAYPDFTLCHQSLDHINQNLKICGLTKDIYQNQSKWIGNCSHDPQTLYSNAVGIVSDYQTLSNQ